MIKILIFAICLGIIPNINCYRRSTFCPRVEPMEGFQWQPFLGNWYLYIISNDFADAGDNCFKNNHTLEGDKLRMVQQWFDGAGQVVDFVQVRQISKPGQIYYDDDVTLYGAWGQPYTGKARAYSTVIFTDYTNVQVRFICQELKHAYFTEAKISYYISIRNRGFDSIAKVAPHIERFRKLGGNLNLISFLKNDLTCTN